MWQIKEMGIVMYMFEWISYCLATQEGKTAFVLGLIAVAMVIDFLSGTVAAKIKKEITSGKGINGILRKATSIIVLMFFAPVSVILPGDTGVALLYTMYLGYLFFEITSILENLEKMGVNIGIMKKFTSNIPHDKK